MKEERVDIYTRPIPIDDPGLTLAELSRICGLSAEEVMEMVDYGLLDPIGEAPGCWRFVGASVLRVRRVQRLRRDLEVNLAGAVLATDLIETIERLRSRLRRFERQEN